MSTKRRIRIERFELTEAQLEALLDGASRLDPPIARAVGAAREIACEMTRHDVGGRHLYVAIRDDPTRKLHIARDGNVTEVGEAMR